MINIFQKFIGLIMLMVLISFFITITDAKSSDGMSSNGMSSNAMSSDLNKKDSNHDDKTIENNKSSSLDMLISIIELRKSLKQRIAEKQIRLENCSSENEKENIKKEISRLDKELDDAIFDFQSIATGIDMGLFEQRKADEFKWQNEIVSLVEPAIKELKHLTLKARQKTKLKEEIDYYNNLLPVADQAVQNINLLIAKTSNTELQTYLKKIVPEWIGAKSQISNKLKVAQMQLVEMDSEDKPILKSSKATVFMALLACIAVVVILRIIYFGLVKIIPNYRYEERPFYVRFIKIFFKISALASTTFILIFVFYSSQDWVLMSISIIFLMGLGWTLKQSIPRLWQQSRLVLNIGGVREGERIIYYDVPWIVKSINVFCGLENPWLDTTIRLPIEELIGKISRPVKNGEPWFPCKKNDWVILSDETWGKVISLSHEMVEVIQRGGARKIYRTQDFLALSPLNLSTNFRIEVMFGIGYTHQKEITSTILQILNDHIMEQIEKEKYLAHLISLRVEFCQAGASSLDLIILADFDGEAAPLYQRLQRAIQRWCVDASTANNWDIPFPQLTVHKGMWNAEI